MEDYEKLPHEEGKENYLLRKRMFTQVWPILELNYGASESEYLNVFERMKGLILAMGNPEGKTVLDLGCGSVSCQDDTIWGIKLGRDFEPWICRALFEMGVNPIGIDIQDNSTEKFENYRIDLLQRNCLSFLKDDSVDVAYSYMLFSSPTLLGKGYSLKANLIPQLERIVKPDGFFIYTD